MIKKIITSILLATLIICSVIFGAVVAMAEEGGVEPLSSATEEKIAVGVLSGAYVANTPVELKNGEEVIGTLKVDQDATDFPSFPAGSKVSFIHNEKYVIKKLIYVANYGNAIDITVNSKYGTEVSGLTDEEMAMLTQAGVSADQDKSCVVLLNPEHTATEGDPYQFTLNAISEKEYVCIIYEKKTYTETIVTKRANYSNIIVGESYGQNAATIKFTGTSDTSNSSITLNDNSRCYITPSPGYVIESVTFTISSSYTWALREEGVEEKDLTFSGSNPTYTLTGFKVGQSYDLYSRTSNYATLTSITVTYTEHEHDHKDYSSHNHDEDNHWDECVCKDRINETPHSWTMLNETHPSAGLAGERKFECSDCHAEKTEIIPCEITDENITVSLANQLRYTSASLTQKVVIKVGDTVLQEYVDYTLSGNSGRNPGNYTLTITGKGKYSGTRQLDFSILKGQVAIPAADKTVFRYTGANQTYNIPTNSRYNIVGSTTKSTAGRTDIVLSLKDTANYEWADGTTDDITYVFEIAKATYDMSEVVFEDNTVTYNGSEFSIEATNLPTGVTVTYENNGKTAAGEYIVIAKFSGDSTNYNEIPDQTAVLTIEKATYNMSGVVFNGLTVIYDGNTYSLEATNLPSGVTVTYQNNGKTNAGTYTVVAKFTGDANYNDIPDMEATLTINKATYDMSGIKFDDVTVTYNGSEHTVVITGTLPNGVTVSYTTNKGTNAGIYNAVASFTGDANYNDIPDMEATLIINKATYDMNGVVFADKTVTYNGSAYSLEATNLPNGVTVSYENNGKTDVGVYTVTAKFTGNANYNDIPDMEATLTINKATYDMSDVIFADKTVVYNGSAFTIEATNLPNGVTVTYENNGKTDVGVYTVTAKFTGNANYNDIPDMEATLTINKATYDMSGVVFGDTTVTYNGSAQSILATNLPDGVTVTYENNGKTDVGVYTVTAKFTSDANYGDIPDMTATLTISKATYDMSGIKFDDVTVTYNGSEHTVVITGTLPNGVTVSYTTNKGTNAGTYNAVASFTGDANYNDIPDMEATLTVNKATYDMSGIKFDDVTVTYNGSEHTVVIIGTLPNGVTVSYTTNKGTNAGTYNAVASFTGDVNYNDIPDMEATLTINKATYDMSGIKFDDVTVTYNGSEHTVVITGTLPNGVTVSYTTNKGTNAGIYNAVASFTGDANYNAIPNMEATLTIKNSSLSFNTNTEDDVSDDVIVSTEEGFDPNKELFVEVIPMENTTVDFQEFLDKNQKVSVAYDIKLLIDGVSVQPDGTLKFRILIPEELRNKKFDIMHIHNNSEKAMLEYEIDGDYVIFESDKLSEFVFIYNVDSLLWAILVLLLIVVAEAAVLIFLMNKKKQLGSRKLAATYPPFVFGMFIPEWHIAMIAILGVAVIALAAIDIIYALKLIKAKSLAYEGVYAEVPVVEESVTEKSTVKNTVVKASIVDNAIANEVATEETVVEETIDYTKCIVGIVWAEKTKSNRVYRYNVGNKKIKVGDIVVAPTFDSHSQKEVEREARVVSIEYYNDGDNIVLPRKSIISVEKKSSKNYKRKF